MRRTLPALLLVLALAPNADAADASLRVFRLNDGRALHGAVAESTAEGMRVRTAQGVLLVRYEEIAEIGALDGSAPPPRMTIALARADDAATPLAAWVGAVAAAIPEIELVAGEVWAARGGTAEAIASCRGATSCLAPLATNAGVDYLVVWSGDTALQFTGYVARGGRMLGRAEAPDSEDPRAATLSAVFAALGITPEGDVAGRASGLPERPTAAPAVAAAVEPRPEPVAQPTPPVRPTPAPRLTLGQTVALGFVPVPGLGAAVNGDLPGFLIAMIGTVATGWTAVYALGANVRWEKPFIASSILVPYALSLTWSEVTGIVGWSRMKRGSVAVRGSVVPILGPDGTASAVLVLDATF